MSKTERFIRYFRLVKFHAKKQSFRLGIELDDAIGYGSLGLWQACNKRQLSGYKLIEIEIDEKQWLRYAHRRITGAIIDGARIIYYERIDPSYFYLIENFYSQPENIGDYHNLYRAINNLSDREKEIVFKSYFDDENLKDIGRLYNISEARICNV